MLKNFLLQFLQIRKLNFSSLANTSGVNSNFFYVFWERILEIPLELEWIDEKNRHLCFSRTGFFENLLGNIFKFFKNRNILAMKRMLSQNHAPITNLIRKIEFFAYFQNRILWKFSRIMKIILKRHLTYVFFQKYIKNTIGE